jgi:hypothetical protein
LPSLQFVITDRMSLLSLLNSNDWSIPLKRPVPEIIDPVFAKTSQKARFLLSENERFGLVFVKTGSINSGTGKILRHPIRAVSALQVRT